MHCWSNLKAILSFIAVARKKSFSRAGDALFLSQPAVTNNIKNLEQELGIMLFDRNKNINLTKGGMEFFSYAVEMLNLRDKSKIAVNQHKNNIEGLLEICASTIPEQYL
ncbi:MAG: LysR family transcriptional regulator, partial [Tissierellia bacterium]|nr:LysR family transcriptional regulator [Tissierellia bacterium]